MIAVRTDFQALARREARERQCWRSRIVILSLGAPLPATETAPTLSRERRRARAAAYFVDDGRRLRLSILAGVQNVTQDREELDRTQRVSGSRWRHRNEPRTDPRFHRRGRFRPLWSCSV